MEDEMTEQQAWQIAVTMPGFGFVEWIDLDEAERLYPTKSEPDPED